MGRMLGFEAFSLGVLAAAGVGAGGGQEAGARREAFRCSSWAAPRVGACGCKSARRPKPLYMNGMASAAREQA